MGHDADDFPGLAVRHDAMADYGSIAAEFALPVTVSQNHHFRAALSLVFQCEPPAESGLDAEGFERAGSHVEGLHLLGGREPRNADAVAGPDTEPLKRTVFLAKSEVVGWRRVEILDTNAWRRLPNAHQPFGIGIWKGFQ